MHQANRILQLCACIEVHARQQNLLTAACSEFQDWNQLLSLAEEQGMGPLLYRHLILSKVNSPAAVLRGLKFLSLRHQQANTLLMKSLAEVLSLFEIAGIKSLVVKGAALCNSLYSEIGLRPMRDIDLLLEKSDLLRAQKILLSVGYYCSCEELPEGHYHLPPFLKIEGGMEISIELHHGLFPKLPPFYKEFSFLQVFENGTLFQIEGVTARTFANEEMLWHLFQHGFHPPLTYETCKLISAADIIALVEKNVTIMDWERIKKNYPQLYTSLPLFHYLSPWSEKVLQYIHIAKSHVPSGVGDAYSGWPRQTFPDAVKEMRILEMLVNSFFPSRWWCMLYYSTGKSLLSLAWVRIVLHPIHLLRWVRICSRMVFSKAKIKK